MAHPKRKISKTRRDKRRTHYKATVPQIATDPTTNVRVFLFLVEYVSKSNYFAPYLHII